MKDERYHRLMTLQQKISLKKNREWIGKEVKVLCEGPAKNKPDTFQARLSTQAPEIDGMTFLKGKSLKSGEFVWARVSGAKEYDLVADFLKEN